MKAFVLTGTGGIDDIRSIDDRDIPVPENDEIRVKVKAAGLNPVDYQLAEGWESENVEEQPVLGLDVAGIVDAVGSDVVKFKKGDRVFYHGNLNKKNGGFAEYACTTAHTASRLLPEIDFVQGAAIPCAGFTAYEAVMQKLRPNKGDTCLIHAGSGGVGGYAIQLAKLCGATVLTTCSGKNHEYVRSLGADEAIDYTKESVHDRVMDITHGRGVDGIIDTLNEESATKDIDLLAFGGQLVYIEGQPDFSKVHFFEKALSFHEVALGAAHSSNDRRAECNLAYIGDSYMDLIKNEKIKFPEITVINFEDIPEYLRRLKTRHVKGKVVANVDTKK